MTGLGNSLTLKPTVREVQRVVCAAAGISLADLKSHCRKRTLAGPRQAAMHLARELCGKSYPQLGREFGGRDHTTVLFAARKIARLERELPLIEIGLNRCRERIAELVEARAASMPAPAVVIEQPKAEGDSSDWHPAPPKRARQVSTIRTAQIIEQADWLGLGGEMAA